MKKIMVAGANSYIGVAFKNYMSQWPDKYQVDTVDMKNDSWKKVSFEGYDAVYHVAGIAHSDKGIVGTQKKQLYYAVNRDLAIETAEKARAEGVKQFIFMSSAIVYGGSVPLGKTKIITKETPVSPTNCYGDSKVQAEKGIQSLETEEFKTIIIRSPMIYGKGCKGNYRMLVKLAKLMPIFPRVENNRSMLYIENLCEFVRLLMDNDESGIFWPQNAEYTNTSEMIKMIADTYGKKIRLTKMFNWFLVIARIFTGAVDKAFGSLIYDYEISQYKDYKYQIVSLSESVKRTNE